MFELENQNSVLIKNNPLMLRILCNGSGSVISHFDEEKIWTDLEFIPLRIDEVLNPYSQMFDGIILGIIIKCEGRKGKDKIELPRGTTIYLYCKRSSTLKDPYSSFLNQAEEVKVMHRVPMQSAIFSPYFTPKSNDKGVYALCKWDVRPADTESEGDIYQELAELKGSDFQFNQLFPSQNSTIESMNNAAKAILDESYDSEALALPEAPDF
jgi:hypothetical protein